MTARDAAEQGRHEDRSLPPLRGAARFGVAVRPGLAARLGAPARRGERGQATVLLVGAMAAVLVGALIVGAVARGLAARGDRQRAADLSALAAARAMRDVYPRLFEPPLRDGRANPVHLERAAYLAIGRRAGEETARRNHVANATVSFPAADPIAPTRVRVAVDDPIEVGGTGEVRTHVVAEAELSPPGAVAAAGGGGGDEYAGPLAYRQGRPMRPDVATAFDRMAKAAHADGIELLVTSAFRTNAEQAALFAAHPDPKWVAPPGTSLHRLGTELDLGPESAYRWLAANAGRFHFVMRYAWEPWHFGFVLNASSRPAMVGGAGGSRAGAAARGGGAMAGGVAGGRGADDVDGPDDGRSARGVPAFVPARFAPTFARAAQRWNVAAALLAAQAYRESGFNPFARSSAGALGIAQFMPGTAQAMGLANPLDPERAIDAQAHLMRDLLRRFGAVPLALAAYNAGPARGAACLCVPPSPETQAYVAAILGMLNGAGDPAGAAAAGLDVRLVR